MNLGGIVPQGSTKIALEIKPVRSYLKDVDDELDGLKLANKRLRIALENTMKKVDPEIQQVLLEMLVHSEEVNSILEGKADEKQPQ